MTTRDPSSSTTRGRPRRQAAPGRRLLLGATAMVVFGSFLPWVDTAVGSVSGARGAGLWTFYAAMLGLAGALIPYRTVAAVQGAILAAVAVTLPVWQVVHLLRLVGVGAWSPGPGLVLVFGGGVAAGVAAWRIHRGAPTGP